MKMFPRMTNSVVMTATLVAVIVGSLCFSAGEGLRLTPFPITSFSDFGDFNNAGTVERVSVAKYGPLDVPAPTQKRSKRQATDVACDSVKETRPSFTPVVHSFVPQADDAVCLSFIAPHSGRAPPLQS
jgi:hypothetical protein